MTAAVETVRAITAELPGGRAVIRYGLDALPRDTKPSSRSSSPQREVL